MKSFYIFSFLLPLQLFLNPLVLRAEVASNVDSSLPREISDKLCTDEEMKNIAEHIKKCLDSPHQSSYCKRNRDKFRLKLETCSAYRGLRNLPSKEAFSKIFQDIEEKQKELKKDQRKLKKDQEAQAANYQEAIERYEKALATEQSKLPLGNESAIKRKFDEIRKENRILRQNSDTIYRWLQVLYKEFHDEQQKRIRFEEYVLSRLNQLGDYPNPALVQMEPEA